MKQAARMQRQMEDVQTQLANRTVEATSGGGAVKVVAKCDGTIAAVKIDPQAVNPAEVQLLEDLILTASNSALSQAKQISTDEMGNSSGGMWGWRQMAAVGLVVSCSPAPQKSAPPPIVARSTETLPADAPPKTPPPESSHPSDSSLFADESEPHVAGPEPQVT